MFRQFSVACLALAGMIALSADAFGQFPMGNAPNPLFSQYVTQGAGTPSAAMYPAPHFVPMMSYQSYYTYQPLMPHEMMYQHSRNYYNYYNNNGNYYGQGNALTKTSVRWQAGCNHMGPLPFRGGMSGLCYRLASHRYCLGGNCGHKHRGCRHGNCGQAGCDTCASTGTIVGAPVAPVADTATPAAEATSDETNGN